MIALKERILLLLEPHVDALAGDLAELMPTLVREQLSMILENATAAAAPAAAKVAKAKPAIATPAKSTARAASSGLTSKGTPRQRIGSCGKCGEVGKRSDSCGITHNIKTKKTSASKIVMRGHHAAGPVPDVAPVALTLDTPPPYSLRSLQRHRACEREASHRRARSTFRRPGGHRSSTAARSSPTYRS